MRTALFALPLLASALILPLAAHADTTDLFTLNNNITFSLTVPPQGGAVNDGDFRTEYFFADFSGHLAQSQLDLFTAAVGGGFDLTYFYPGGPGHIAAEGAQLFSGTTADPTILPGTYKLTDRDGGIDTLIITQQPPTPSVPEPSTLLFLTTGALALALSGRWVAQI